MAKKEKPQKWLENAENKIPGRGYRTPVATPLDFPYPLERDFENSINYVCKWSEEHGGLYLGQTRYQKNIDKNKKLDLFINLYKYHHSYPIIY